MAWVEFAVSATSTRNRQPMKIPDRRRTDDAGRDDDGCDQNHAAFDEIECHRDGRTMALEKLVGNDAGTERTEDGDERHQVHRPKNCGRFVGHVQFQLVVKIKNHQLVGTVPNRAGAGIGEGVEPNERMREDGGETIRADSPGCFRRRLARFDEAVIACFARECS